MKEPVPLAIVATMVVVSVVGCGKNDADGPKVTKEEVVATQAKPKAEPAAVPSVAAPIAWLSSEGEALAQVKESKKLLLVDFSAKWCSPCEELEEKTFSNDTVRSLVSSHFIPLRIDVSEMDDANEQLMKKYGARQLPVILVRSPSGDTLARWDDFVAADVFAGELSKLSN